MNNTLLISEKLLKSVTLINDNIDGYLLQPAMVAAQEINLQNIIGTKLLNKLKQLVYDGEIYDNEDYQTLLDQYIVPFLCWDTLAEVQIPLNYKVVNSGIVQNSDERKTPVSLKDLNYIVEYYKEKSKFFSKRLTDYLTHNSSTYPEYRYYSCGQVNAKDSQYCNIYLGSDYYSYWGK